MRTDMLARRRKSAWLSAIAAGVTASLFLTSAVKYNTQAPNRAWLLMIALPPIVLSVAAWVQYLRTTHTGAGAAAAAVYWVMFVVFFFHAGEAFVLGALLQTVAWYLSRPTRRHNPAPQS